MEIHDIIEIQKKLLVLIKKYEEKTVKLLSCDVEEIEMLVSTRGSILDRIGVLSGMVIGSCGRDSIEVQAFTNKCDRGNLPSEFVEIFDLRQEFNIYAIRSYGMEPEIIERIQIKKDVLLEKIKKNNSSATAKAARYYNGGLSQGQNLYFPKNKKKI